MNFLPAFCSESWLGWREGIFKIEWDTWKMSILPPISLQIWKAFAIAGSNAVSWAEPTGDSK